MRDLVGGSMQGPVDLDADRAVGLDVRRVAPVISTHGAVASLRFAVGRIVDRAVERLEAVLCYE